jgi:dienelactone hydrolase
MKKMLWLLALVVLTTSSPVFAKLQTRTVEYKEGDTTLEGYLAYDDSFQGKRPGILVVHEWTGLGKFVKSRVEKLTRLGYVAFAADIYGQGVRPKKVEDCMATSSIYYKDRALFRRRVNAGLAQLEQYPNVDPDKLGAMGYCFGGAAVLELGRSGAPVKGIVTFHGGLDNPTPADAKNIKAKVLINQGGADGFTLPSLPAFEKEMTDAGVDYKVITYPDAQHSFTNPEAKGQLKGALYNKSADEKSWKAMTEFFGKLFNS